MHGFQGTGDARPAVVAGAGEGWVAVGVGNISLLCAYVFAGVGGLLVTGVIAMPWVRVLRLGGRWDLKLGVGASSVGGC